MATVTRPIPAELVKAFDAFRDFLYQTSGIYFSDRNRDRLLAHVAARMEATGTKDPQAYLALLRSRTGPGSELWQFFNQVTVNETYFFRERPQYTVLRDRVLPGLFERRRAGEMTRVNIWSAACSSGEEAYSLAILIKESFPGELGHVSITGFDINSEVIEQAKKGEYSDYAIRQCTPDQKRLYFRQQGNRYVLVPYIRRLVQFHVANMMELAQIRRLPQPHLVLCRNVLIYFDKASKSKVLQNLAKVMRPGGYLFLSQTESLFGVDHPFELVHFFRVAAYRLKGR